LVTCKTEEELTDPKEWGLTKTIPVSGQTIKDTLLKDTGAEAAFSKIDSASKAYLTGVKAASVSSLAQTVNGRISYVNSLTSPTVKALYNVANTIYQTACTPVLRDRNATIAFTTNFLMLAQFKKLKGITACILNSPLLHPDELFKIIKNIASNIKISGDLDALLGISSSPHSRAVVKGDPDFFLVFLHTYKLPTNEAVMDYEDLFDQTITAFTELEPNWNTCVRDGQTDSDDSAAIAYASDDFIVLLSAKARNGFYDIAGADPVTFDLATNTALPKYWLAVAENFEKVDTRAELKRLYPSVVGI
jgi:hypothetical protein